MCVDPLICVWFVKIRIFWFRTFIAISYWPRLSRGRLRPHSPFNYDHTGPEHILIWGQHTSHKTILIVRWKLLSESLFAINSFHIDFWSRRIRLVLLITILHLLFLSLDCHCTLQPDGDWRVGGRNRRRYRVPACLCDETINGNVLIIWTTTCNWHNALKIASILIALSLIKIIAMLWSSTLIIRVYPNRNSQSPRRLLRNNFAPSSLYLWME